ncbi:MAG: hypothetical protein JW862_13385 [Anaerolineales bacterium]|nr:hypothetical protein [Anaerolineales bacterium]
MAVMKLTLREDYWDEFELQSEDVEFLYNHLLEIETPLTPQELITALVAERIQRELRSIEQKRLAGAEVYLPGDHYEPGTALVFPAFAWQRGEVVAVRPGSNPDLGEFSVIQVQFEDGEARELAAGLETHKLNQPQEDGDGDLPVAESILAAHQETLAHRLEQGLSLNDDFVRIAGKWFPRALLVDVHAGHLNLAEAVLDMTGGGPLPTRALLEQIELSADENPKLVEFSLDLALQEDERFDEVGPEGEVLWYLQRLEPEGVRKTPLQLKYHELEYEADLLTQEMKDLVQQLGDELSELKVNQRTGSDASISLIYPHWRAGTLPLAAHISPFFPTAYEAPRIRFMLVDGDTGEKFPAWVVRDHGYVFGLEDWYRERGLMPGSIVRVKRGKNPGEVIVHADTQRSRRDWVRTVLVGSDGGVVFAMLKQVITAAYDERMAIAVPDEEMLDELWRNRQQKQPPFERTIVNMVRELAKLNPQNHVHVIELYAVINLVRRCPPEPILALLASRPWFTHVGDLHFRFDDSESK